VVPIRDVLRLHHLAINTSWPKHPPNDSFVELESVGGDERSNVETHPVEEVSKQVQRIAVASFANHRRRPKPGLDIHPNENPDRLLLA
jgi:hypothetical protein